LQVNVGVGNKNTLMVERSFKKINRGEWRFDRHCESLHWFKKFNW